MGTKQQEEVTEVEFWKYERVRQSGAINMFYLSKVQELSGLQKDKILAIMEQYSVLMTKYGRTLA